MSDTPQKKRMARAKQRAQEQLHESGHVVVVSNNDPVCLVAYRGGSVRLVRICLDAMSPEDRRLMKPYTQGHDVSAECWVSRLRSARFIETRLN